MGSALVIFFFFFVDEFLTSFKLYGRILCVNETQKSGALFFLVKLRPKTNPTFEYACFEK